MADKLRLSLTLQALEALIGGDSEVEVQLRNSVVQEFAKRHLKGVAHAEFMRIAEEATREIVREEFGKSNFSGVQLSEPYKQAIRKRIRGEFDVIIDDAKHEIRQDIFARIEDAKKQLLGRLDLEIRINLNASTLAQVKVEVDKRLAELSQVIAGGK